MSVLLSILAWLLIALGALLGLLLVMPLGVRASGEVEGLDAHGRVDLWWGLGLIGVRLEPGASGLALFGVRVHRFEPDSPEEAAGERQKKRERRAAKKARKAERPGKRGPGWAYRHRRLLLELARKAVVLLHLRGSVEGLVGLDDPADTAALDLLFEAMARRAPWLEQDLRCDFTDERLWLRGQVRAWMWPLEAGVVILAALARRDVRRALFASP